MAHNNSGLYLDDITTDKWHCRETTGASQRFNALRYIIQPLIRCDETSLKYTLCSECRDLVQQRNVKDKTDFLREKNSLWSKTKRRFRDEGTAEEREACNRPSLSWRDDCSGEYRDTCSNSVLMRQLGDWELSVTRDLVSPEVEASGKTYQSRNLREKRRFESDTVTEFCSDGNIATVIKVCF